MEKCFLVTGIGGSGTRLIGEVFHKLDYDLGQNLNEAYDNLDTAKLFNKFDGWDPFTEEAYPAFKKKMLEAFSNYSNKSTCVLKTPNFMYFVPYFAKLGKELSIDIKWIHVIRDGLYMINSKNQNQFNIFPNMYV